MQNNFIQMNGDQIIIDKNDLIALAIAAVAIIVVAIVVTIVFKNRKKDFIKTLPTNLKEEK